MAHLDTQKLLPTLDNIYIHYYMLHVFCHFPGDEPNKAKHAHDYSACVALN